ncbi:MAG TPA: PDZ domain-containing protein [Gemmataceae bacterium]|jgi:S1-C subfamily serine protease/predicted esterase|nr:PDZ domain-containing protein [Gemmataceae bacterium]
MLRRYTCFAPFLLLTLGILTSALLAQPPADDTEGLQELATKAAVAKVSPSVVQIETSGGSDILGSGASMFRKGAGPTTGLVVAADGYIISSAFNFANKPSAIFVSLPGHKERYVAKVIATDTTRMLTLLKIEAKGLPVPEATPKKEIQVGRWSLALGRAWAALDGPPSISAGIVSAIGRIWGKAIQTDAKVSPLNYGGPLVDLHGRVMGVLVPASPRGQDETAGVEWYDSGIGFAIPLEDINRVLPKLKEGKDLNKGMLGIYLKSNDIYGAVPEIASVGPDSSALRAGIKPGDVIIQIDGHPVVRQAQILHLLGEKYEGDTVNVKLRRGKEELTLANIKLTGNLTAFIHPFLGVVPVRDDPELGEEIRYVFAKSPADVAGLKPGDRIMKLSVEGIPPQAFSGRDELSALLDNLRPGLQVTLEVTRKATKKKESVKVMLGVMSDEVPDDNLPEPATLKKALEPRKAAPRPGPPAPGLPGEPQPKRGERKGGGIPKREAKSDAPKDAPKVERKKGETGLLKRTTPARDHEYWVYVPENYDPNIAHALVIWLHPAGKAKDKETETVLASWEDFCSDNHVILLCPRSESESGWLGSEVDFIQQVARDVIGEYTIDRQRVVAHGMGMGGQMAYYLAFNARNLVRGVAPVGAALSNPPKDNVANERLAFFITAGGKDPALPAIQEGKTRLAEHKFPVVYREIADRGSEYLDAATLQELVRWLDALDRQ